VSRQDAKTPEEGSCREPDEAADALARVVLDAALEVHWHLGPAFVESVYENALCRELSLRRVPFERQVAVPILYKKLPVGLGRADLVVGQRLLVELKALPALGPIHQAQVISYLKATRLALGLLLNFGERHLKTGCRRVILTR
jgi:GxxExxY protein